MPRLQVAFVDGLIDQLRQAFRLSLNRAPEVDQERIHVVHRFDSLARPRRAEQHRPASEEWLDLSRHVAESPPDFGRDAGLAAEVWERCGQRLGHIEHATISATIPAAVPHRNPPHHAARQRSRTSSASQYSS